MTFAETISNQLAKNGIHFDPQAIASSDLLDFMLLEEAHCLDLLENEKLDCLYDPATKEGKFRLFLRHEETEWVEGSLFPKLKEPSKTKLAQANKLIYARFPASENSMDYNANYTAAIYQIDIHHKNVKEAIKKSAIFVAAGDLSQLSTESLLMTQHKLKAYQGIKKLNSFAIVNNIVKRLDEKIYHEINSRKLNQLTYDKTEIRVKKQVTALQNIRNQELVFLDALSELEQQGNELIYEGKDYQNLWQVMKTLKNELNQARQNFFNNNPSFKKAKALETLCTQTINQASLAFAPFQGTGSFYNDLHPVLQDILNCCKALVGILAAITIIPGLLVHKYSHQGFWNSFFKTQTNLSYELNKVNEKLLGENGVIKIMLEESQAFTSPQQSR